MTFQPLVPGRLARQEASDSRANSAQGRRMTTLFEILGVPRNATDEAVRTAFRKAAKAHHPDLNLGDPAAEPQLRQIIAAYHALKTAQQRAVYNEYLAKEEQYWRSIGRENN